VKVVVSGGGNVAVDTQPTAWARAAEEALRRVRGIDEARIQLEDDEVREIHIITSSTRPAKQIVRDVQGLLQARFQRAIDYRVVSVVYCEPAEKSADSATAPVPAAAAAGEAPRASRRGRAADPAEESGDRVRFVGVNLFVSGPRTQAQVELRWKGLPRMGSASGWGSRGGAHRLIAQATLAAVQEFLADDLALAIEDVQIVRHGRSRVVLVSVVLVEQRDEKLLIGACTAQRDLQRSVVLATLSALNRLVGGLQVKQPTEYVLRPAST
jgi:hypothetical protein